MKSEEIVEGCLMNILQAIMRTEELPLIHNREYPALVSNVTLIMPKKVQVDLLGEQVHPNIIVPQQSQECVNI